MRIYTRTGDTGETGLFGGGRVPKFHARIAAYGDVDELNSVIGWAALPLSGFSDRLAREQSLLFIAGSWLATPPDASQTARKHLPAWPEGAPTVLEQEIDAWDAQLEPLKTFIIPGGTESAARLHIARTVCRRAERAVVALAADPAEEVDPRLLIYLNRLSDWLFTAARAANAAAGRADVPWQPAP